MRDDEFKLTTRHKNNLTLSLMALGLSVPVGVGAAELTLGATASWWWYPTVGVFTISFYSILSNGLRAWEKLKSE